MYTHVPVDFKTFKLYFLAHTKGLGSEKRIKNILCDTLLILLSLT